MNSNALDLLASLQSNSSGNKFNKTASNPYFGKNFQDILSSKQQTQHRSNISSQQNRNNYKRNEANNVRDKKHEANYDNRTNETKTLNNKSTKPINNSKVEKQGETNTKGMEDKTNIEEVEININEIEKTIESILSLIQQLGNLEDNNSLANPQNELLASKLKELMSQLEAVKGNDLGQALLAELQDMSTEILDALEELVQSKELVGLDSKHIINIKDVLNKLNNIEQSTSEINTNPNKDDKGILMNSSDSSPNKENDENSKAFGQKEKGLLGANANGDNIVSDTNSNQNKAVFNQAIVNRQIQMNAENQTQLKGETAKLYDVDKNNVIKQIVDKVKVDVKGESSQIKIKLKPDFLGEMSLKLSMEKGIISAKAMVQDYQVKQLIESNLAQLKDNLEEQGISITEFEVSVGDESSFQRQNMNWNRQNNRKFNNLNLEGNEVEYDQYSEIMINDNYDLGLDELETKRSSINLMA